MPDHFNTWAAMQLEAMDREDRAAERSDYCRRCHRADHQCRCHLGARVLQFPLKNFAASGWTPDAA